MSSSAKFSKTRIPFAAVSVSCVLLLVCLVLASHGVKGSPLPRIGASANPKPVPQADIDRLTAVYEDMDCRWRSLGCDSTDGPFAVTYIHMTRIVLEGVENSYFDDGSLMVNFTINFANRYLDAIDKARRCSETPSAPWAEAFNYGDSKKSSVVEDTFLGINAHINYDLALTVEELYHDGVKDNKDDYDRINDLLQDGGQAITDSITEHYDPLFSTTANAFTMPIVLQMLFSWRGNAWNYGQSMALASSGADRDLIHGVMLASTMTHAQVFKTYNFIWFFQRTDGPRIAYCNANQPPAPTGPCDYPEC